jgi:hypothetical protein
MSSNGRDFDDEREQREWSAQESALRAERAGGFGSGAGVAEYRLIARALRMPPLDPLPGDFAAQTAARALREQRIANETVEIWLERGLVALLLVGGAAVLLAYRDSLPALSFSVPAGATVGIQSVLSWSLAVAACVGFSSVFRFVGKR